MGTKEKEEEKQKKGSGAHPALNHHIPRKKTGLTRKTQGQQGTWQCNTGQRPTSAGVGRKVAQINFWSSLVTSMCMAYGALPWGTLTIEHRGKRC